MVLETQSINSGYIPQHKIKTNFLDYYEEFVKVNSRKGNRSLACSLSAFKDFLKRDSFSALDITENLCEQFRNYLLDNLSGETLMKAYCSNYEVKKAAIFSLYTGLRWCDVAELDWQALKEKTIVITQEKTIVPLEIPLHPIAKEILGQRVKGKVFHLPTQDGANKVLGNWVLSAGIDKHITWHCLRHSISVLLQDKGTDAATVAGMLGHTTTKYVHKTYQRYKVSSAQEAINRLPT